MVIKSRGRFNKAPETNDGCRESARNAFSLHSDVVLPVGPQADLLPQDRGLFQCWDEILAPLANRRRFVATEARIFSIEASRAAECNDTIETRYNVSVQLPVKEGLDPRCLCL